MEKISIKQMPSVKNENLIHLQRYVKFINSRPERKLHCDGFDTHHIYPKSLAKRNNIEDFNGDWNLIELTKREHFIAHLILYKCGYQEMVFAFWRILTCGKYETKITSRQYDRFREKNTELIRLRLSNTVWINNGIDSKQINPDSEIPLGWSLGMADERMWINNGIENKLICIDEEIPAGFEKGRLSIGYWIHNNIEEKYIDSDTIPIGFEIGRLLKTTKDTNWYTNGIENKMLKSNEKIPNGYTLGLTREIAQHRHITNGIENKYLYEGEKIPDGWKIGQTLNIKNVCWINDGIKNKRYNYDEKIPDGWKLGRLVKGFFITNDIEAKLVTDEKDIPSGWRRGRIKRTKKQIELDSLTI